MSILVFLRSLSITLEVFSYVSPDFDFRANEGSLNVGPDLRMAPKITIMKIVLTHVRMIGKGWDSLTSLS